MASKVGIVESINDGKFFAKDSLGNTKELKNGDIIYENDVVFSDGSNSSNSEIRVALEGEDIIVLKNGVQQLFDSSLIASTFGNEEMVFTKESIDAMLDSHSDMTNVWSNLNEEGFSGYQDVTEEETAAGEEEEEVLEEGSIGQFALRDGALVDVISDLRKKSWARSQDYREVENSEKIEKISLKSLGGLDSTTNTPPPTVTPPPLTPPTVTPPTITPPPPVANLSIDDITMYEQDGFMVFTVTLDIPASGNITVNFTTSNGTAESGKDYTPITGIITIPSGSSTAQIRVPINDDYYYEKSETFNVTLTNPTGNVNIVKPVGVGTILDNPPTTEKTPTTNNTPDSGTGTYDSGDTVYVKLVNSATTIEDMTGITGLDLIEIDGVKNDGILEHFLQLVDKNGKFVEIPDGKSITVTLEYYSFQGTIDDGDFDNTRTVEITLTKDDLVVNHDGTLSYKITNHAIMDGVKEDLESYYLKIIDVKQNGDAFENVVIHKDFDTVTGTIIDVTPIVEAVVTPEDTAKTIELTDKTKTISKMLVDNGKGFVEVSDGDKVDLYDNGKVIGTITYDQSGKKFTFTPNDDYSNYKNADVIKFMYFADFGGTSNEFKQVSVQVTPVVDAPEINFDTTKGTMNGADFIVKTKEDDNNTKEGSHKIALGLITPKLSKDQTDKNGAAGDHPERNGEITLKFTNGSSVSGAKLFNGNSEVANISSNNQEIKVVIVTQSGTTNVDYTYHHKDITASNPSGTVLYLTKSEYENLKIQHKEDNDTDIKINIGVTSYELDDDNKPLDINNPTYSSPKNANMTVEILPVTDNISIKWNDTSKGTYTADGKTYTFNNVNKQKDTVLNIKDIMSATSGAGTDTKLDLDGSEKRTYIVDGLPTGTKVTIGTGDTKQEVTVGADGKATIVFNDTNNKANDPDFKIELPDYYTGTVNGTITLQVQDKGVEESGDISKWGGVKTDTVNFKINVMPTVIADSSNETIHTAQAIGNEDAGRSKNNILNSGGVAVSSSGNITNPENGLKLNIEPKGSSMVAKGETATVWIDKVPVGGAMWVFDKSAGTAGEYKLIGVEGGKVYEYTKDGSNEYTVKTELVGGKIGNISVTLNGDNTYKVQILDYQNSKLPTFIPPHNDDKDYTFKISGEKVSSAVIDGQTVVSTKPYNGGSTLDMSIIVKNLADEPINTELVDSAEKTVTIGGIKYIKATEDTEFKLADIYKNPPSSYDNDSEVLSIKITLPTGVTMVNGKQYHIDGKDYVIKASDLNNIKLTFDKNFSGTVGDIKLKYITTETSGENSSKTHFEQTVKLFVNPKSDDVSVAISSTIHEDADGSTNKINLKPTLTDTDGSETITSVKILASSVPAGYDLFLGSVNGTSIVSKLVDEYYVLTPEEADSIYAKNTNSHSADNRDNFDLTVVYTVKDEKNGQIDTKDFTHTHNVIVKAVTDAPTISLVDGETKTTTAYDNSNSTGTQIINKGEVDIWSANSDFTVQVKTESLDKDGSEEVQRIEIHGVPKGVTVDGAVFQGYTGTDSGVWVIYPSDKTLNSDGASTDIKFTITEGANFNNRDMTIKTITKDIGAEEKSATLNVNMEMKYTYSGPGTGGSTPDYELVLKTPTIDEEKPFTLKDLYGVSYNAGNIQGSHWAADFTDLPAGTTFKVKEGMTGVNIYTYTDGGGKLHYVVSGSNQNKADIESVFERIEIITPKDKNSLQVGDLKGDFSITGTISSTNGAYAHQGTEQKYVNYTINPVTDPMTVTVETSGTLKEDEPVNLTIKLSNGSDKTKAALVDGVITLIINESWSDNLSNGTGGVKGTLGQTGTDYTIVDNNDGTYTITKASGNFVLDSNGNLDIPNLVYTPATNRDGDVKFEVSVKNQETESSVTLDSKGDKTITVTPAIDTTLTASTVVATGTEDLAIAGINLQNPLKVTITADGSNPLVITDKSETLGNIVLDKIPNGMTVWYKDTDGTLKMATNIGTSTGNYVLNPNGDNTAVSVNKWLIPTNGSNVVPEIYVNAPENWAGTFNFDVKLSIYEQNLSTPVEKSINSIAGTITAVADGVTGSATKSTKNVFQWADLQLNANMKDTDGSEVMNVELTGLSKDAQFKLKDGNLTNPAVWDVGTSKWTISGIKVEDINKIQFMDIKATTSVTADIWTKEQSNSVESDKTSLTGLAEIKAVTGTFTFDKELSLDFDNIDSLADGSIMNNVTKLDLGSNNGAKNELLNLTLKDILDMGKNENGEINLTILGGGAGANQDKVSFKNETGKTWEKGAEEDGFVIYTNTGDSSVKVKVQTEIETLI
ncbi:Calx-beta domain-containing protein [Aliarcobacter cryaerophilus]|uniref:Calx-beta domain-containing protein n=1 Tax=Aliarcobacter cryaerophilus TaxID=28198 RepID=UPI003DA423FC